MFLCVLERRKETCSSDKVVNFVRWASFLHRQRQSHLRFLCSSPCFSLNEAVTKFKRFFFHIYFVHNIRYLRQKANVLRYATNRSASYGCLRQLPVDAVRLVSFNMNRLCKTFVCGCLQITYIYVWRLLFAATYST